MSAAETAPTAPAARLDEVRPARLDDLGAIAGLFHSTFRKNAAEPSAELVAHLRDIYFEHPWQDDETPSRVFVSADGTIDGFIGVLPLRLRFQGTSIKGAIAGALMVRAPQDRPLAGARLLRSFLSGPQAFSSGDTANWSSQTPWEKLGGRMLPLESLEWVKIIRLGRFGAGALARRLPRVLSLFTRPLGKMVDLLVRPKANTDVKRDWADQTVDDDTFLAALSLLAPTRELTLDLDADAGRWLLARAAAKTSAGMLHRRIVNDRRGRPIGCYLVYCKRGDTAEALMVVAHPKAAEAVFASMVAFAAEQGCASLKGRGQAPMMNAIFKNGCLMRQRCSTVVHSPNPALMQALELGHAPLGGFFGETWTRLVSDDFGQIRGVV